MDFKLQLIRSHLTEMGLAVEKAAPAINLGGCGIYAHAIGERLRHLGVVDVIEYKIQAPGYVDDDEDDLADLDLVQQDGVEHTATWWSYYDVYINHVYVKIQKDYQKWYVDTESFGGRPSNLHPGSIDPENLRMLNEDVKSWNDKFNRRDIPKVIGIVDRHFEMLADALAQV